MASRVTVATIARMVSAYYGLDHAMMISPARYRKYARPRQIVMHVARLFIGASTTVIGNALGGRDHSTILHGTRCIRRLVLYDPKIASDVMLIRRRVARFDAAEWAAMVALSAEWKRTLQATKPVLHIAPILVPVGRRRLRLTSETFFNPLRDALRERHRATA